MEPLNAVLAGNPLAATNVRCAAAFAVGAKATATADTAMHSDSDARRSMEVTRGASACLIGSGSQS